MIKHLQILVHLVLEADLFDDTKFRGQGQYILRCIQDYN